MITAMLAMRFIRPLRLRLALAEGGFDDFDDLLQILGIELLGGRIGERGWRGNVPMLEHLLHRSRRFRSSERTEIKAPIRDRMNSVRALERFRHVRAAEHKAVFHR